ncbi:hypothetical protein E4U38_001078, partial [Claviceps purpurea]
SWLQWLSPLVVLTFIWEGIVSSATRDLDTRASVPSETLYAFSSILIWFAISIFLIEGESPFLPAYILAWALGAVFDAITLGLTSSTLAENDWWGFHLVGVQALRIMLFVAACLHCLVVLAKRDPSREKATVEETRSLLHGGATSAAAGGTTDDGPWTSAPTAEYGSARVAGGTNDDGGDGNDGSGEEDEEDKEIKSKQQKRLEEAGGWLGYLKTLTVFLPVILPYNHRPTQLWIIALMLCIGAQRFLTYMVPRQFSLLTEAVTQSTAT